MAKHDITWTMNCILFGARIIDIVKRGDIDTAKKEIKNLTSAFDDNYTDYIITRLKDI